MKRQLIKNEYKSVPRNITYEAIFQAILDLFSGDKDKALRFYMNKNEIFDNHAPYEMVKNGKALLAMKTINKLRFG